MLGELLEAKCSLAGPCKPLVLWRRWSPSSFGGFFFTNPTGCSQKRLGTSWRYLPYDVRLRKGKSSPCNRDKMCCLDPSPLSVLWTRSVHLWGDERQKVSPSRPFGDLPLYLDKWKRKNIWSQGGGAGTMWMPRAWQVPKRPQPGAQHPEGKAADWEWITHWRKTDFRQTSLTSCCRDSGPMVAALRVMTAPMSSNSAQFLTKWTPTKR